LETSIQDVYSRLHDISGAVSISGVPVVEISGNVVVSDLSVNVLNSSLDVHNYASSNGSTWHHLASDANGRIITLSRTHDGSGNDITSETFGLGGASRGLHTIIGNTSLAVTPSNTDSTAIITRPRDVSNAQVATSASVSGPMRIGSANADTQGYTYISAIMSFTSVTTGGNVFLEVSHDGSLFARPSGASTVVNTSGANVTASILLSAPVPFRYARLWADSGLNSPSVNAWIVMK
jgi:hypothetical protein